MDVAVAGFVAGLSLIVAIGAQNAYVLRLGLARDHVAIAVAICASADAVLIVAGVAGIGAIVRAHPTVLTVVTWVGVAYLLGYAAHSFWRARRPEVLLPGDEPPKSARTVAVAMLGFTLLNPHVYLDTVLLLGSIANQHGDERWWFAAGAATASVAWFSTLGFGATIAAPLMSRPITWRILDVLIGLVMILIAVSLLRSDLTA